MEALICPAEMEMRLICPAEMVMYLIRPADMIGRLLIYSLRWRWVK